MYFFRRLIDHTLTFVSVRGEVLATVEIDGPDDPNSCVVVRYFPALESGRPRRAEVELRATT